MRTLLDDATATAARITLGANDAANLDAGIIDDGRFPARLRGAATPSIEDCNTVSETGFYSVSQITVNSPATLGSLIHYEWSSTGASQIMISVGSTPFAFVRTRGGGVWSAWRPIYSANNVLGTVSQNGGVPTGAIIEKGSNSNGRYTRFADGTQICFGKAIATYATSSALTVNADFPSQFADIPDAGIAADWSEVQGSLTAASYQTLGNTALAGISSTQIWLRQGRGGGSSFSSGDGVAIHYVATGRWP